jgi:hypothetical protein
MVRFSEEFQSHTADSLRGLGVVSSQLADPGVLPSVLKPWFTMLWHAIRATTPLFNYTLARLSTCPDDDFHRALADFYRHKIEEESGHDQMMLNDLVRLGASSEELHRTLAPAPIAAMIGSQYYLIDCAHPCAYLGYLALVEGNPLPLPALAQIEQASQAPQEAWSTYRLHAEVDPWHRDEINEMLDRVPNDRFLRGTIISNALRSAEYYCQALEELLPTAEAAENG